MGRRWTTLLVLVASVALAQTPRAVGTAGPDRNAARRAAEAGLPALLKPWADIEGPLALRDDVRLAAGLPVFFVRLDRLRDYDGDSPLELLLPKDEVLFLVATDGPPFAAVSVERREERWVASAFGGANLTRRIREAADRTGRSLSADSDLSLVQVPALNAMFIAHYAEEMLLLTPVFPISGADLEPGAALPVSEAMRRLSVLAREHDGLPR